MKTTGNKDGGMNDSLASLPAIENLTSPSPPIFNV